MSVIDQPSPERGLFARMAAYNYGGLWFVLAMVAAVPVFWYGFVSLGEAWSTAEYSHGPLIPILSLYLFLRDMRKVPPKEGPVTDRFPGVIITVVALAIAIFGNLVKIPDIVTYAFIIWVGGMVLLSFGFTRGIVFWTGVLHLVYMLPLPQFLYWQLTIWLQLVSSELGVWFIRMLDIPVFLEGNVIDLGVYKLLVAEACSGLRYLFPILSFSYVFCVLYNGPVWHRVVILISAAPITVFMNAFRIGMIGVLVDGYGIEQAEGFLHYFEGWVIFGACVGILFLLAILMQRLQRNPKPISEALDVDFDGLGGQMARMAIIPRSGALVTVACLTALVSALWVAMPTPERPQVERKPFAMFPLTYGEWSSYTTPLDTQIETVLAADDYVQATFIRPGVAAPVGFFSAFYHKQTEGSGIHSPEVCLPVGGWEMNGLAPFSVDLEAETGWAPFQLNRAIIQKENGLEKQVVYYWFEQRGRRMTNDFAAKLVTIWDSFRMGRSDGALVRFTTPVAPGESEADAEARLRELMVEILPELPQFLPE